MDGWIRIGVDVETKDFEQQINSVEKELLELEKSYAEEKNMKPFKGQEEDLEQLALQIEKTRNKLIGLQNQQNKVNDAAHELSNVDYEKSITNFEKTGTKAFKSLTKGAKTLLIGLIGIRSAYSLVSKISHAALQNNEKLGKQIESIWTGLGALLEPVIEVLVQLFKKAATSVLYFASLLTHENLIEKANAAILKNREKQLKNQTKATKELNNATKKFSASFDELNMVQDQSSSVSDTIEPLDDALLFNINDLSKSTIEFLEKLAQKIKPIADTIKNIIDWAKEHPDVIIGILGGTALLTLLKKIIGVESVSGLLGISGILLGLAALGVISIGINIYTIGKTADELYEGQKLTQQKNKDLLDETRAEQQTIRKRIYQYNKNTNSTNKLVKSLDNNIEAEQTHQKTIMQNIKSMSAAEREASNLSGALETMYHQYAVSIEKEEEYITTQYQLARQGKLTDEQYEDFLETLEKFNEKMNGAGKEAQFTREAYLFLGEQTKALKDTQSNASNMTKNYADEISKTKTLVYQLEKEEKKLKDTIDSIDTKKDIKFTSNANKTKEDVDNLSNGVKKVPSSKDIEFYTNLQKFKEQVEKIKQKISEVVNSNYVVKVGILTVGELFGIDSSKLNSLLKKLFPSTKMATGGIHIVNNPGRGVISGNVMRGEAGSEGVLPLTDARAMEMLGEEIGKHIVLNATLINKINGRTLSKEVQQILTESGFYANS